MSLEEELSRKITKTLAGLSLAYFSATNANFDEALLKILHSVDKITIVYHYEVPEKRGETVRFLAALQQTIKAKLKPVTTSSYVWTANLHNQSMPWTVSYL